MRILVYGINFSPELTGIGKYSGELVEWLTARGHEVRVVCAAPYYPDWKVFDGYSAGRYSLDKDSNKYILRCPVWVPRNPSGAKRLLHLLSFALSSFPALFRSYFWKPEIVVVVAPALFCAPGGALFARLCGSHAWLHIQDFEVDAAFDLGLLKGALLRRLVSSGERWLLRRFDKVSTISGKMVEKLFSKGLNEDKVKYFPNWVDISKIRPIEGDSSYRKELGISSASIVALYSGNMGGKQGLEILASVAKLTEDDAEIVYVFCGNGSGKQDLMERCQGLKNVIFIDLQPLNRLSDLLGLADIHLLPQKADAADLVMPSKLTGMLASGRPVVATAELSTELGQVVNNRCGIVVPPEFPDLFADAIRSLAASVELRRNYGKSARKYAEKDLGIDSVLNIFEIDIASLNSP